MSKCQLGIKARLPNALVPYETLLNTVSCTHSSVETRRISQIPKIAVHAKQVWGLCWLRWGAPAAPLPEEFRVADEDGENLLGPSLAEAAGFHAHQLVLNS